MVPFTSSFPAFSQETVCVHPILDNIDIICSHWINTLPAPAFPTSAELQPIPKIWLYKQHSLQFSQELQIAPTFNLLKQEWCWYSHRSYLWIHSLLVTLQPFWTCAAVSCPPGGKQTKYSPFRLLSTNTETITVIPRWQEMFLSRCEVCRIWCKA